MGLSVPALAFGRADRLGRRTRHCKQHAADLAIVSVDEAFSVPPRLKACPSETAPSRIRGTVVAASLSWLIVGQLIAYWVDYAFTQHYEGDVVWRVPFSLQIMAAVIMCILVFFMPESPRYLISMGDIANARIVLGALGKLDADDLVISRQVEEIQEAIVLEQNSAKTWGDLAPESWKRRAKGEERVPTGQDGETRRMLTVSRLTREEDNSR